MRGFLVALVAISPVRVLGCTSFSASAPDARTDGSFSDAATDSPTSGRWCDSLAPKPYFCADFDGEDPFAGWNSPSVTDGSKLDVTAGFSRSAPHAAHATLGPAGTIRKIGIRRDGPEASHYRVGYSLYLDERPVVGAYELNIIRFIESPNTSHDFFLAVDADGVSYVEQRLTSDGGASAPIRLTEPIQTRRWTRVVIELDVPSQRVTVTIDGVRAADTTVTYAIAGPIQLNAGITFASASVDRGSATIDDFVLETL